MTVEDRRFWLGFLFGGALFALAMGWTMEHVAHRAALARHEASLVDQVILAEALKLGVPDPLTRALVGANAVRVVGERQKAQAK